MSEPNTPVVARFIAAGIVNTAFSYAVFALLYTYLGSYIGYLTVLVAAYVINASFAFLTQALFVFRQRERRATAFARFNLVTLGSLGANAVILHALVQLEIPPLVSQVIAIVMIAAATFVLHQIYTFRHDRVPNDQTPSP
jgi:putative flippase GtrA